MTNREFLNSIISTEALSADVRDHAKDELAKLDARNAKRASKPSKTAIANEPIKKAIVEWLKGQDAPTVASAVAGELEMSTQKASALCRQLVADGELNVTEVKVKGKGKQKGYSVV